MRKSAVALLRLLASFLVSCACDELGGPALASFVLQQSEAAADA